MEANNLAAERRDAATKTSTRERIKLEKYKLAKKEYMDMKFEKEQHDGAKKLMADTIKAHPKVKKIFF